MTESITISRVGSFELEMSPEYALPLFTAPGEKLWIEDWDPTILSGDGTEKGTVFVTSNGGHTTYWTVVDYDTPTCHARYVRVTPGQDIGTVDVSLKSNGLGGAIVTVSYQLTSLSEQGTARLREAFSPAEYSKMMGDWKAMIGRSREAIDAHFAA